MCVHLNFDHRKATQAINFFANKAGGYINKMKAIKLIYFADRYHLRKYGRPITNDEYFAMPYGPVNSGVKEIAENSDFLAKDEQVYASTYLKVQNQYGVKSINPVENKVFSKSDIEALSFAWDKFGKYNQYQLADLSHNYPEWKRFKEIIESKAQSRVRMNYEDFFEDPGEGYEKCCTLTIVEKEDRIDTIKEIDKINSLRY
jgi:uncharacterized phage-associated protein